MTVFQQPEGRTKGNPLRLASLRTVLIYGGTGILLVAVLLAVGGEITHHLRTIDVWLADLGLWGWLAFVGLFVVATSLFVPETLLAITAGTLFGLAEGLAAVVAGGLAAAAVQFLLSRWILRSRVEKTVMARPSLAALQRAVLHNELRLQVMIRLTPVNPATLNYLLGAAGVRLRGFLLASFAFLPHQAAEVYFGYAGRHVIKIAGRSGSQVYGHDAIVFAGLLMSIVILALITRAARRTVASAVAEAANL